MTIASDLLPPGRRQLLRESARGQGAHLLWQQRLALHRSQQAPPSAWKPWLVAEYEPGDAVVFTMHLVHGGLDNHSDRLRLSSDSRYQLASKPVD